MRVSPRRGLSPPPLGVPGICGADPAAAGRPAGARCWQPPPLSPRSQRARERDGWSDGRTDGQGLQERDQPLCWLRMAAMGPSPSWPCSVRVGWVEEVVELCILVGGWQVTPSVGETAAVPLCEVVRRRSLGFVARAFSGLLLGSKAGVRCHFFPGSAPSFSACLGSFTGGPRSPDEYFRCLKREAEP